MANVARDTHAQKSGDSEAPPPRSLADGNSQRSGDRCSGSKTCLLSAVKTSTAIKYSIVIETPGPPPITWNAGDSRIAYTCSGKKRSTATFQARPSMVPRYERP